MRGRLVIVKTFSMAWLTILTNALVYAGGERVSQSGLELVHAQIDTVFQGEATRMKQAKNDYNRGNYLKSLRNALIVERKATTQQNDTLKAEAGNVIALNYMAGGRYNDAFPYLKKAAVINKATGKWYKLAANLINLSLYHSSLKHPDSAIFYADSSFRLSKRIGADDLQAMAGNHLGNNFALKGKPVIALKYYENVLNNKDYQSDWENSFASTGMARLYLASGDLSAAIRYGEKSFFLAHKIGTKWDAQQSSEILYQAYQRAGNFVQAFKYLDLFRRYSDSLYNEKKNAEINYLLLKQKEFEIRDLKKDKIVAAQKRKIDNIVAFVAILIAAAACLLVWLLYQKIIKSRKSSSILQKQYEDIQRKSALINKQNLNLNQLNYTKDQLFAVIGHDLRTPFSNILTTLELFRSGDLNSNEVQTISGKFYDQVSVTAKMLDNLLLWGSSQLGGITSVHQIIDLPEIVNEVFAVYGEVAAAKEIRLLHQPRERVMISADRDQIRIIVQNLLANAIKFTKPGGEVVVFYVVTDAVIELAVRDTGVGMSPDTVHQLLRYGGKKVSTYGTANEKGIGLGLLLVKDFAELNNATISVQSVEMDGTTFYISFSKPLYL